MKLLLANNADVGVTPLYIAAHEGHTEAVRLLLAKQADAYSSRHLDLCICADISYLVLCFCQV